MVGISELNSCQAPRRVTLRPVLSCPFLPYPICRPILLPASTSGSYYPSRLLFLDPWGHPLNAPVSEAWLGMRFFPLAHFCPLLIHDYGLPSDPSPMQVVPPFRTCNAASVGRHRLTTARFVSAMAPQLFWLHSLMPTANVCSTSLTMVRVR